MGDGPLRPALEAEVEARGLGGEVVFLGQQSNPYAVMRRCQYGLLTSSREGFPNVVLEMMACGMRKVVMTPCAGDLDSLTGVSVTSDFSPDSLAGALADAIREGEDFSATYRAVVEGRSVERYLDAVLGEAAG
jgi:glycosyltransferase involved in cell wall biosynthesis